MTVRSVLRRSCALAPILCATLAGACATARSSSSTASTRDYAYVRARDSIVVAVSVRDRSSAEIQRALEGAVARVAAGEGCEPGAPQLRGEQDPRLAADALAYLRAPHRVAVASCAERPAMLRAADLRALQWIVGTWRGSGDGQASFYERYRFLDDSTLLVESFKDSTLADVSESTRYELRGGRLANAAPENAAQWVAVRLTDGAITFAPVRRARNRFIWRPESADVWIAELAWPASNAAPARARTYRMVRWTPPAR
jgi:hypothetical protein